MKDALFLQDSALRRAERFAKTRGKYPELPPPVRSTTTNSNVPIFVNETTKNLSKSRTYSMERKKMTTKHSARVAAVALTIAVASTAGIARAEVHGGDVITPANASKVENLVSPGNFVLVERGMKITIEPAEHLEWPPPYKDATEKYSSQAALTRDGNLGSYIAGLPFPLVDANDPQAAEKIMWNFQFRPSSTDDLDARNVEVISRAGSSSSEIEHFTLGHLGFYNSVGRTEVSPTPIDVDVRNMGIASRGGVYPILEPAEMRGAGIVRERSVLPNVEDYAWEYSSASRRLRRLPASELSDSFGVAFISSAGDRSGGGGATTYASTLDPNSEFGFSGKVTEYDYRLLGERTMLASVSGDSPARACSGNGARSVCENWQLRRVYVIEATEKPGPLLSASSVVPKRILYIDSEGWFITASDLYDREGRLWKTIANFHAYSDRATPAATVSIWPFKRMFETAMVDEDLTNGFTSVIFTPGHDSRNALYLNMGAVDRDFFTPARMVQAGH